MDTKKKPKKKDINVTAFNIVKQATDENPPKEETEESSGKNPNAVALGRLGGLKGGKARAEKLSKERRRDIARKAAEARWSKKK